MKFCSAVFLVALAKVCFSMSRTTSTAQKADSSYRNSVLTILSQRYFNVEYASKISNHNKSNVENSDPLRSLVLQVSSPQDGLTGDPCTVSSDCDGLRTCQDTELGKRCFFINGGGKRCDTSVECTSGERCYTITNVGQACVSESAAKEGNELAKENNLPPLFTPIDDGSTNDPCIGTHLLTHLSRNQLVFEKDILSNVLCDEHNSCATAGHMVSYHGKGMMMESYCEMIEGCTKKVMHVNSPRYNMKATVPSLSENMVFTAFSARYITRTEEGMLAMAIRLGF